jgi:hypothetical protein
MQKVDNELKSKSLEIAKTVFTDNNQENKPVN